LIISGPVPKGDDQLFEEYRARVENLVNVQRSFTNKLLAEARQKIASSSSDIQKEGFILSCFVHSKGCRKTKR